MDILYALTIFYAMLGTIYSMSRIDEYNNSYVIKFKKPKNRIGIIINILFFPILPFATIMFYLFLVSAWIIFYPLGELLEFLENHNVNYKIKKRINNSKIIQFLFEERN